MRYLSAAHGGRVAAPRAGRGRDLPARPLDLPRLVRETRAGGKPDAVSASIEPRFPGYARLRTALARLRALAAAPPLPEVPLLVTRVSPGDTWSGIPAVRDRLIATGDLPAGAARPADPDRYDPALEAAVKNFQERHSVLDDGILGKRTVAAMNVPPASRARQVELALERWRWLPDPERRVVVVEIPRAVLQAVDVERGTTDLVMRTVVGESRSHATPMLASSISTVVFRPYWIPPPGILKEEILPRERARPGWLAAHGMEIVARPEEDAETFEPTEDVLSRVADGELILRQHPGPRNDLGAVKFPVADVQCIALHGTPYGRLFELPKRDRSHGCIRLQDPGALARWVLGAEPGWDAARIAEAVGRERSTTVKLREPVQVVFVYGTAAVDADGSLHFVEDAYGLDAQVERELARQAPAVTPGSGRREAR
jgi:murein L,D-transpeptidase YcbB/YkuD